MARCEATCGHYRIVQEYRDERATQLDRLDNETRWPEEEQEWLDRHGPIVTFKQWLTEHRRPEEP